MRPADADHLGTQNGYMPAPRTPICGIRAETHPLAGKSVQLEGAPNSFVPETERLTKDETAGVSLANLIVAILQ